MFRGSIPYHNWQCTLGIDHPDRVACSSFGEHKKRIRVMALGSHVWVLWSLPLSCERYQTITVWMDPFRVAELHVPLWPRLPIIRQPAHQEAVKSHNMARANSSCGLGMIQIGVMEKNTLARSHSFEKQPMDALEPVHSKIMIFSTYFSKD